MRHLQRRQLLVGALTAGACTTGAPLIARAAALTRLNPRTQPANVAILVDDQATVIDFAGPWEVFQDAGVSGAPGFRLYTVAPSADPIRATSGLHIIPDFTLTNAPQPNVVIVGAQSGGRQASPTTADKVDWLRRVSGDADIVMSVCTGAYLLARTGLLDGLEATTHHAFYEDFEQQFPHVNLVRNRRFVDNGKFMSAGGLTSGIDGALHVVARYYGEETARAGAAYMEHDDNGWVSGRRS